LETNQRLFGQPNGLTVGATPLIAGSGSNPTITNTAAGGDGITLANGVNVQRVDVSGTNDKGIVGSAITNATIGSNISITSTGGSTINVTNTATSLTTTSGTALLLNNVAGTIQFNSVSVGASGTPATGIGITNVTADVTINGGTIQNTTTAAISLDDGNGDFGY